MKLNHNKISCIKLVHLLYLTKYLCDSVNHSRIPEELHLPGWVCRD